MKKLLDFIAFLFLTSLIFIGGVAFSAVNIALSQTSGTPPERSGGYPTGILQPRMTPSYVGLQTSAAAYCKYSTTPIPNGTPFSTLTAFTSTGSTTHSFQLSTLTTGSTYAYYVRCKDMITGAENSDDYLISFSVSNSGGDGTTPTPHAPIRSGQHIYDNVTYNSSVSISITTDIPGECRYRTNLDGTSSGTPFESMVNTMQTQFGTSYQYSQFISNAVQSTYYIRCRSLGDSPQVNTEDFEIQINTVASAPSNLTMQNVAPYSGQLNVSINPILTAAILTSIDPSTLHFYWELFQGTQCGGTPLHIRAYTGNTNDSSLSWPTPTLTPNIIYAWHVKAKDNVGTEGSFSQCTMFKTGSGSGLQPPVISNIVPPSGSVVSNTPAYVTISLNTDKPARCKFSTTPGTSYAQMSESRLFSLINDSQHHSYQYSPLTPGQSVNLYIRCHGDDQSENTLDYPLSFTIQASTLDTTPPTNVGNAAPSPGISDISLSPTLTAKTATDPSAPISYYFELFAGTACTGTPLKTRTYDSSVNWNLSNLLSNSLYAWRVKAKDGADNASAFGPCTSFKTAQVSTPYLIVSNGEPRNTVLPAGTTQVIARVRTNVAASCRYSTTLIQFAQIPTNQAFEYEQSGNLTYFKKTLTNLHNGQTVQLYVLCRSTEGAESNLPYLISFSIGGTSDSNQNTNTDTLIAVCGNGIIERGEDCDGSNLNGKSCQLYGMTGTLVCSSVCRFTTTGCRVSNTNNPTNISRNTPYTPPSNQNTSSGTNSNSSNGSGSTQNTNTSQGNINLRNNSLLYPGTTNTNSGGSSTNASAPTTVTPTTRAGSDGGTKQPSETEQYWASLDQTTTARYREFCARFNIFDPAACRRLVSTEINPLCRAQNILDPAQCDIFLRQRSQTTVCAGATGPDCEKKIVEQNKGSIFCGGESADQCTQSIDQNMTGSFVQAVQQKDTVTTALTELQQTGATVESIRTIAIQNNFDASAVPVKPTEDKGVVLASSPDSVIDVSSKIAAHATLPFVILLDDDKDGLPNDLEVQYGTNPHDADTDVDGYSDLQEIKSGYDPLSKVQQKLTMQAQGAVKAIIDQKPLEQPIVKGTLDTTLTLNFENGKNAGEYSLSGVAEPNADVLIYLYSPLPLVLSAKADSFGNWNYTLKEPLTDTKHAVYTVIADDTGSIVKKSTPFAFFVKEARAVTPTEFLAGEQIVPEEATYSPLKNYYILLSVGVIAFGLLIAVLIFMLRRDKHGA